MSTYMTRVSGRKSRLSYGNSSIVKKKTCNSTLNNNLHMGNCTDNVHTVVCSQLTN